MNSSAPSYAKALRLIRRIFHPSQNQLFSWLGAGPTTLHRWRSGKATPDREQARRLAELALAAELMAATELPNTGAFGVRVLIAKRLNGRSLIDVICAGEPVRASVHQVIEQLLAERTRREELNARFRDRPALPEHEVAFLAPSE